jgi:hypothetical protein
MLLATYLHEDSVDEEGIAIVTLASLQPSCIQSTELDAPQAD